MAGQSGREELIANVQDAKSLAQRLEALVLERELLIDDMLRHTYGVTLAQLERMTAVQLDHLRIPRR